MEQSKLDMNQIKFNPRGLCNVDKYFRLLEHNLTTPEIIVASLYLYKNLELTADQALALKNLFLEEYQKNLQTQFE